MHHRGSGQGCAERRGSPVQSAVGCARLGNFPSRPTNLPSGITSKARVEEESLPPTMAPGSDCAELESRRHRHGLQPAVCRLPRHRTARRPSGPDRLRIAANARGLPAGAGRKRPGEHAGALRPGFDPPRQGVVDDPPAVRGKHRPEWLERLHITETSGLAVIHRQHPQRILGILHDGIREMFPFGDHDSGTCTVPGSGVVSRWSPVPPMCCSKIATSPSRSDGKVT